MPKSKQNKQFQILLFLAFAGAGILILYFANAAVKSSALSLNTLEGELEVLHQDFFEQKTSKNTNYLIDKDGKRYELNFGSDTVPPYLTGSKIRVLGLVKGNKISLKTKDFMVLEAARPHNSPRKLAVLNYKLSGSPRSHYTNEDLRLTFYDYEESMDAYFTEISYGDRTIIGKNSLNGENDVYGLLTINLTNCDSGPHSVASAVRSEAVRAGADLSGYDNIVYFGVDCGWLQATLGGSQSWIAGTGPEAAHELGHNFGVHHSNEIICRNSSGNQVILTGSCGSFEYGDTFDVMGSGFYGHFNGYQKSYLGWFTPENVVTATTTGEFSIKPLETALSDGIKVLRIPKGVYDFPTNCDIFGTCWDPGSRNAFYYLEFRQPVGFDNKISLYTGQNAYKGVQIRLSTDTTELVLPLLIDMTPGSLAPGALGLDNYDAALEPGRCYTDTERKITIETLSASSAEVRVKVTFNSIRDCLPAAAPKNLRVNVSADTNAALAWDNVSGAAGYHIYRSDKEDGEYSRIASSTVNSFVDNTTGGKYYWYKISSYDTANPPNESYARSNAEAGPNFVIGEPQINYIYVGVPEANLPNICPLGSPGNSNGKVTFRGSGVARIGSLGQTLDSRVGKVDVYFDGTQVATLTSAPSEQKCFRVSSVIRSNVPLRFVAFAKGCTTVCSTAEKVVYVDILP